MICDPGGEMVFDVMEKYYMIKVEKYYMGLT